MKTCSGCFRRLSLKHFWRHPTCRFGRRSRCKRCLSTQNSEWVAKNHKSNRIRIRRWDKVHRRRRNLRSRYGITVVQYDSLLAKQKGVCAICGKPPDGGKRLAVDHDHKTGKIRGLLHVRCNTAIGLLLDNVLLCRAAAKYLELFLRVSPLL